MPLLETIYRGTRVSIFAPESQLSERVLRETDRDRTPLGKVYLLRIIKL